MYSLIRSLLFQLSPETAHSVTLKSLQGLHKLGFTRLFTKISSPVEVMGITFPNPVGLAAGLDKNGEYIECLSALGFGFIEIGSITPKPQVGNPKPRLFRLTKQEALINRMGFNNHGLDYAEEQLKKTNFKGILGINIGKNKDTPLEKAVDDYVLGFRKMAPYASYITINISSPNTPGLRDLQQGDLLKELLMTLKYEQSQINKHVPLVVKVAPDLSPSDIKQIAEIILETKVEGLIATNTTTSRDGVKLNPLASEVGGLSGKPLFNQATKTVRLFHDILQNQIPIIACGGIMDAQDALQKFAAGASLIQIYSGLIYRGPSLITDAVRVIKRVKC